MDEHWKETFRLHSKTEEYHNKIKITQKIIKDSIRKYKCYIAYSGGKDSTVMLHLILQEINDIFVFHWDYGRYYVPYALEMEIINNAKKIGAKNLRVETSNLYEREKRDAKNIIGKMFIGVIGEKLKSEGYNGTFVGLRAEESSKRNSKIKFKDISKEITELYPIAHWNWKDVWGYIISNELPYPTVYDKYAEILGWDKVRLVTFFDKEFDWLGNSNIDGVLMTEFKHFRGI